MKNIFRKSRGFLAGIALAAITFGAVAYTNNYFEISKNMDIFTTLYKELNTYYVDDVDPNKLMRDGIDAMLTELDPYTSFISEAEMEDYRLQTTGKYGGIGAVIRKAGDYVVIVEPYEGSPADNAGLRAGDKIIKIDGESAKGKTSSEVSTILKGQPGTPIKVTIQRMKSDGNTEELEIAIDRQEIKIDNVPFFGMVDDNIAYIYLAHFTDKAGKEVADALTELKANNDVQGVILDLRGNPGGLLNEAVNVSNVFIPKGQEICSTKGKIDEWDKTFKTLNQPVDTEVPLVVLTNRGSASASEIVSGSIQDLDRGVVIGQKTFGKGLVQTTRNLTYNTKLKVTTAKYYIPSGRCIQAINYAERDEDGAAVKIPDSLKTSYTTQGGRIVWDGAGIDPDVYIDNQTLSKISVSLLSKDHIFDFATWYRSSHESIANPRDFQLTDKDFEDFVAFLEGKEYDYQTKSEKELEELKAAAEKEGYFDAIEEEYNSLMEDMMHDKEQDLFTNKDEIIMLLEEEIVMRYYYRNGQIQASFDDDEELVKAIDVLKDMGSYKGYLASGVEVGATEE